MAELLPAARKRRRHHYRQQPPHDAHGSALRAVRRTSRSSVPGRSGADGDAVLHERRRAQIRTRRGRVGATHASPLLLIKSRGLDRPRAACMLGTQHLLLFITSGLLLNLTPGQDTFYIIGRSIAQGRRAGMLSVLGITSGCVVHTLAAAFGLSAILATSVRAFLIVKFVGAAYLGYLVLRLL